jgi:hypothetical protein
MANSASWALRPTIRCRSSTSRRPSQSWRRERRTRAPGSGNCSSWKPWPLTLPFSPYHDLASSWTPWPSTLPFSPYHDLASSWPPWPSTLPFSPYHDLASSRPGHSLGLVSALGLLLTVSGTLTSTELLTVMGLGNVTEDRVVATLSTVHLHPPTGKSEHPFYRCHTINRRFHVHLSSTVEVTMMFRDNSVELRMTYDTTCLGRPGGGKPV